MTLRGVGWGKSGTAAVNHRPALSGTRSGPGRSYGGRGAASVASDGDADNDRRTDGRRAM